MAERIGQALVHTKCLKVVSTQDQEFRDSKDIILEIGEDNHLKSISTSPTVADAPNWFLSNDDESHIPVKYEKRASLTETSLDVENDQASFHRKRLFGPETSSVAKEASSNIPVIIEGVSEEMKEEEFEEINKDESKAETVVEVPPTKTIAPGHYVFPPTTSLHPLPFDSTIHSVTSFSILDSDAANAAIPIAGFSKATQVTKQFEEMSVYNEIKRQHLISYHKHLDAFILQLLKTLGLSCEWLETIRPLILTASHTVSTDITPDDHMDISTYCKVKKIPGGRMSSSSFINGVVFTKHVTHKKMNMSLRNPRILLLKCAFEFQRKENQLSSFDTLLSQEQEYLKNLVERVKRVRPSIIFVQKSVSRFALEILHSHGIVVVVNIKPSVMSRIARSTQADLVTNLDQLFFDIKLGTCGHFYVRTYTLPDGVRKTLIYLDECEPRLGGVIMLQGSHKNVLKRVKKVVLFGLQIAHNMKLESSYLTDLLVVPSASCAIVVDQVEDDGYITPPLTPTQSLYRFSPSLFMEEAEKLEEKEEERMEEEEEEEESEEGKSSTTNINDEEEETEEEPVSNETNSNDEAVITSLTQLTHEEAFQHVLSSHIISMSPYMSFSTPYLQTEQGMKAHIRPYLPQSIYWSHWFQPLNKRYATGQDCLPLASNVSQLPPALPPSHQVASHSYRSVSSHPFTHSTFLLPINSSKDSRDTLALSGYQAALADFRSRAMCHLSDDTSDFFFPSAKRSANMYCRLEEVFAGSREFELQAGNWWNEREEESFPAIREEADTSSALPYSQSDGNGKEVTPLLHKSLTSSLQGQWNKPVPVVHDDDDDDDDKVDNGPINIGLTQVREMQSRSIMYTHFCIIEVHVYTTHVLLHM